MTNIEQSIECPLCGSALHAGEESCPHCRATPQWQDFARAIDYSRSQIETWLKSDSLSAARHSSLDQPLREARTEAIAAVGENRPFPPDTGLPSPVACWRCGRGVGRINAYCNTCGAPLGEEADELRYVAFLRYQIDRAAVGAAVGEADFADLNRCKSDLESQAALRRSQLETARLSDEALSQARLTHLRTKKEETLPNPVGISDSIENSASDLPPIYQGKELTVRTRRSILEILLDPHSIQWLLASGGGLLVVGLVIWLASLGVFKNALVVAASMGVGTLSVLAAGIWVVKRTRYQLAGRAITLLACLVMPLNLWFYHAHGLVTLDGHLWLAALICCALYAGAAAALEDPVFVYVLAAGVTMTGMLVLGDLHKLSEVAGPSTLLVALGLIALHVERVFVEGDGPFSRKRFGMASFWSGQILLGMGLMTLLAAQLVGWLPIATALIGNRPLIVTDPSLRMLAIALVLGGGYAYFYSGLIVRRVPAYFHAGACMLLWAGLLIIHQAHLIGHPSALICLFAAASLALSLLQRFGTSRLFSASPIKIATPLPALTLLITVAPALMGLLLYVRATLSAAHNIWPYSLTWPFVAAMAFTAICSRISAQLSERGSGGLLRGYLSTAAATTLIGGASLLTFAGIDSGMPQLSLLMLVPLTYLLASRLHQDRPIQKSLITISHTVTAVLIALMFVAAFNASPRFDLAGGGRLNLEAAGFCLEAALFYAISAILAGRGMALYLATALFSGAIWQLQSYWNIPGEYQSSVFAAVGLLLLALHRLGMWQRLGSGTAAVSASRCGNLLMSLSLVAGAFSAMSRIALGNESWTFVGVLAALAVTAIFAALLARSSDGGSGLRRWYVAVSILEGLLALITIQKQAQLGAWQNVEVFSVIIGLLMLCSGYSLWYREQDVHSAGVSASLIVGSLLAGLPLLIAAIINRFGFDISVIDELGLATVSIFLFITGFMFRLRAPTLIGGSLLALHLSMLLVSMGMQAQLAVGVYLAFGGAALFSVGLFLSIHRDRLLHLPQKIKAHEGVFKVLAWR